MDVGIPPLQFDYVRPAEFGGSTVTHPVVVVGAGPVGLSVAIDLAQGGQSVVLLDDDGTPRDGVPGDLLRQTHPGDFRPAGLRRQDGGQGRRMAGRPRLPAG